MVLSMFPLSPHVSRRVILLAAIPPFAHGQRPFPLPPGTLRHCSRHSLLPLQLYLPLPPLPPPPPPRPSSQRGPSYPALISK